MWNSHIYLETQFLRRVSGIMRLILKLYKLALVYILTAKCYQLILLVLVLLVLWNRFYVSSACIGEKKISLVEILWRNISLGSEELNFT